MKKVGTGLILVGVLATVLGIVGEILMKIKLSSTEGADGPTVVFGSGRLGGVPEIAVIVIGIVLIVLGIIFKKK
ncbi:MAG: oxaloacetate decarboxylase [Lachnospiraceae bacterium]